MASAPIWLFGLQFDVELWGLRYLTDNLGTKKKKKDYELYKKFLLVTLCDMWIQSQMQGYKITEVKLWSTKTL